MCLEEASQNIAQGLRAGQLWDWRWKEASKGLDTCLDMGVKEMRRSWGTELGAKRRRSSYRNGKCNREPE